jgi:hypothetical protein
MQKYHSFWRPVNFADMLELSVLLIQQIWQGAMANKLGQIIDHSCLPEAL